MNAEPTATHAAPEQESPSRVGSVAPAGPAILCTLSADPSQCATSKVSGEAKTSTPDNTQLPGVTQAIRVSETPGATLKTLEATTLPLELRVTTTGEAPFDVTPIAAHPALSAQLTEYKAFDPAMAVPGAGTPSRTLTTSPMPSLL